MKLSFRFNAKYSQEREGVVNPFLPPLARSPLRMYDAGGVGSSCNF